MPVHILLPDGGKWDCVVFMAVEHGAVVIIMVLFLPPFEMVSLFAVVSLLLILVTTLVVKERL